MIHTVYGKYGNGLEFCRLKTRIFQCSYAHWLEQLRWAKSKGFHTHDTVKAGRMWHDLSSQFERHSNLVTCQFWGANILWLLGSVPVPSSARPFTKRSTVNCGADVWRRCTPIGNLLLLFWAFRSASSSCKGRFLGLSHNQSSTLLPKV